ncbi:uncharacterized protein LOC142637225 [Castanea sativa]|uniref:uncharacterized protein LOC142637225 n=1 Tax=Castanea sativa TaxID=21020 RepID=UPI003F64CAAB
MENLSPIDNTILKSIPSFAVRSRFARNFATVKPKPPLLRKLSDAPPSSRTYGSKRKTSPLVSFAPLKRREDTSTIWPSIVDEARIEAGPISSYIPMSEDAPVGPTADTEAIFAKGGTHEEGEVFTEVDASMKRCFFADANVIAKAMAAAIATATSDVSAKAMTPSPESVPANEGAPVEEKILEGPGLVTEGISAEVSIPPRGGDSPTGTQTEEAPLTSPSPIISSSDPFVTLSQVVKGGPSLVVTTSSIPMTIGSEVLEKQEVASVFAKPTPTGPSLLPTKGAESVVMEPESSFATAVDLMEEVTSFFVRFEQVESNDLDPVDFWGIGPPYVDFHGYQVPKDCLDHLQAIYQDHRDFMQKFPLGRSAREHFLKLLGCVLNDIQHNSIETISMEKILQWRAAIQELIRVEFELGFVLDQLREIAQVFFRTKIQPTIDAIDARIESLKKEKADLEAHCARLLSSVAAPDDSHNNPLVTGLM